MHATTWMNLENMLSERSKSQIQGFMENAYHEKTNVWI